MPGYTLQLFALVAVLGAEDGDESNFRKFKGQMDTMFQD
jgi:hypothetical protein